MLFGDYNPSGKLPVTFYKSTTQLAGFEDYSMKGRTYRFMSDPLFPFGYGLSYTTFSIGNTHVSKLKIEKGEAVTLNLPVKNTGKLSGTEILQVYVRKVNDKGGPLKTLRGFKRVSLAAGRSANETVELPYSAFEFYNEEKLRMEVTPGDYEILYGNSSDDRDLKKAEVTVL